MWSVQASKQASIDTHTRTQWSHASVGLAQARPNYSLDSLWNVLMDSSISKLMEQGLFRISVRFQMLWQTEAPQMPLN